MGTLIPKPLLRPSHAEWKFHLRSNLTPKCLSFQSQIKTSVSQQSLVSTERHRDSLPAARLIVLPMYLTPQRFRVRSAVPPCLISRTTTTLNFYSNLQQFVNLLIYATVRPASFCGAISPTAFVWLHQI